MSKENILSPVGRIVLGNLYEPNTKDMDGKPLVVKNGPNQGQPRVDYFFAIAIPKQGEQHWAQTPWGAKIYSIGAAAFPHAIQQEDFAWKIEDGDDTQPKRNYKDPSKPGRINAKTEGFPGNWILKLSRSYAPKIYTKEGNADAVLEQTKGFVKPGYFVEVYFMVEGNKSTANPGVYLNHMMVCFRGYGPEIFFGLDANEVGFGQGALPQGASAIPAASGISLPISTGQGYVHPTPINVPVLFAPAVPVVPTGLPQIPGVIPRPEFLGAVPPPLPIKVPVKTMTPKAAGATYEQFVAAGYTDDMMITQGYMVIS